MRLYRAAFAVLLVAGLLSGGGCAPSTRPGDLTRVQPLSDKPRVGNVYLLRGWIGVFSAGIDNLGVELNDGGVRASVYQEAQWLALARAIKEKYRPAGYAPSAEPLVLVGHSFGADSVLRVSKELAAANIPVDLVVTLDPVNPPAVPANVRRVVNLYQSSLLDGLPMFRGIPVNGTTGSGYTTEIVNLDIREDRTDLLTPDLDHFNIEKQPLVHSEVLRQVLAVCPPRGTWRAGGALPPLPAGTVRKAATTRSATTPGRTP